MSSPALKTLPLLASLALASPVLAQTPLSEPLLPAPLPGIAVRLDPLVALPAEDTGTGATSGVEYVLPIAGSNTLFATDTFGSIYRTSTTGAAPTTFLNLQAPPAGDGVGFSFLYGVVRESGLSGVAFNPNFAGNPALPGYGVFYTASTVEGTPYPVLGGGTHSAETVIQEWTAVDPNAATFSGTSRVVLAVAADTASHNIGTIAFNPTALPGSADYGMLYIASGDDQNPYPGSDDDPQSTATPGGKILRIDPVASNGAPYSIPADNPFVSTPGALPEVWAYGLRNPQSFSWDSATGAMYIDDIGESSVEEVDLGMAGANYGWPLREGTFASDAGSGGTSVYPLPPDDAANGFTYPIAEYDHTQGNAIGPGFVYHGTAIPALDGQYVFSDFTNGLLFYTDPTAGSPGDPAPIYSVTIDDPSGNPECLGCVIGYGGGRVDLRLGEDDNGNLFAVAKANGEIYSIDPASVPEPSSLALFALPLAALLARRRQKNRGQTGEPTATAAPVAVSPPVCGSRANTTRLSLS